ncbi:MAG TPA: SPOR domain-containing protein [Ferruginibacter sp.]|nr:SPOR domain-containing protein [Ferruginibacter sp.]HMP22015.1 SPOR domain-containing protein [Ferruginibacter sp.]
MKKSTILLSFLYSSIAATAQTDSLKSDSIPQGSITVYNDPRLNELQKKEAAINELQANSVRSGSGYRLQVISSNDRELVLKVRSQLLQRYPDQKVYMTFQPPYIKLKFGNFLEKTEAEQYRKEIEQFKLVTNNIYIIPEKIEVRPEKLKELKEKEGR